LFVQFLCPSAFIGQLSKGSYGFGKLFFILKASSISFSALLQSRRKNTI
jgi:hypothetical protein